MASSEAESPSANADSNQKQWNPALYDTKHSFVWKYGAELIEMLAPQPGERILDLGCGTGHLTRQIAESGAKVVGLDRSLAMLVESHKKYPELPLLAGDAAAMAFARPFDAVFSNATLHWVLDAEGAVRCIAAALRPGGRLVLEMGGKGNLAQYYGAFHSVLRDLGYSDSENWNRKYFPSSEEYSSVLERNGLAVRSALLFERPTPLAGGDYGLRDLVAMFEQASLNRLRPDERPRFLESLEERLRAPLFRDGQWHADYVRLRLVAMRT
jgi:trans-aconitate methyltransferase